MVIIVVVSDLYKMNFNPVAQKSDFKYLKNNKNARLSNKKAIISTTTGSSGDIHKQVLFHISHGIVEYTGMQCLDTLIAYEIDKDQNSRDEYIEFFKNKIKYI